MCRTRTVTWYYLSPYALAHWLFATVSARTLGSSPPLAPLPIRMEAHVVHESTELCGRAGKRVYVTIIDTAHAQQIRTLQRREYFFT